MALNKGAPAPANTKPVQDYTSPAAIASAGGAPNAPAAKRGRPATRGKAKSVSVRIPDEIREEALELAFSESSAKNVKSLSDMVVDALTFYIKAKRR